MVELGLSSQSLHMEAEIPKGCSRNTYKLKVCEDVVMKQGVAYMEPSIVV